MKQFLKHCVQYILFLEARVVLHRHHPDIIAITGSTNKTVVKEAILEAFRIQSIPTRANPKSYNTEIGLPLAILYLPSGHSSFRQWFCILIRGLAIALCSRSFPLVSILEFGVDTPGDMTYLLKLVPHPLVTIVTDVTSQYISQFGSLDAIANEYQQLINRTDPSGLVVLNSDDQRLAATQSRSCNNRVTVGTAVEAHARIESIEQRSTGMSWTLCYHGSATHKNIERFGLHHLRADAIAHVVSQWYIHR